MSRRQPTAAIRKAAARAIEAAGGGVVVAAAAGVTKSAVTNWKRTGVPAGRAPIVAELAGMSLHEVRPDLFKPQAA